MKKSSLIFVLLCLLTYCRLAAQDPWPEPLSAADTLTAQQECHSLHHIRTLDIRLHIDSLPATFKNRQENRILHEERLYPFFDKLSYQNRPVRIVHIGDSHVRGHVFSVTTRHRLEEVFGNQAVRPDSIHYRTSGKAQETGKPGLVYHTLGINGATTVQFTSTERLEEIAALKPDLIILSFGTNESHNKRYTDSEHIEQMDALLTLLYRYCPNCTVMLTTPPGSYVRLNRRKRIINPRTHLVVDTLLRFAERRQLAIWDLYDIAGGKERACLNWKNNHYMQRDQIHYTHEGYRLQGALLSDAILKAFEHYVAN